MGVRWSSKSGLRLDHGFDLIITSSSVQILAVSLAASPTWLTDIDVMAVFHVAEFSHLLDRPLISCRQFVRRPRSSDPWFDAVIVMLLNV
jgi:hypothetical protein